MSSGAKAGTPRFEHHAMATAFEVFVGGHPEAYALQAAQAAFAELDRLERLLSRYQESSEISAINRLGAGETFRVSPETAECLEIAYRMHALTGGAFDPALGHATGGHGAVAKDRGRLSLDTETLAVRADHPVALDLGAIGKGYALDRMADVLREWGADRALLVAGGSSILALERPEGSAGWEVSLGEGKLRRHLHLERQSIGTSGTSVKGEHIVDPLTLGPTRGAHRAWAVADLAAESDALSTAWMCLDPDEIEEVCRSGERTGAILQMTEKSTDLVCLGYARELLPRG